LLGEDIAQEQSAGSESGLYRWCLVGAAELERSMRTDEIVVALDKREVLIKSAETSRVCQTAALQVRQ